SVILEALRDHSPQTLVVDEISTQSELEACLRVKQRDVRLVVGAVGQLPSVLDSDSLGFALGGVEACESSDDAQNDPDSTPDESDEEPQKERRAAKPVFDVVVEMEGEFLEDGEHPRCAVTV
ncbi:unnamed protein product, partial [Sphacelaria rigidula]